MLNRIDCALACKSVRPVVASAGNAGVLTLVSMAELSIGSTLFSAACALLKYLAPINKAHACIAVGDDQTFTKSSCIPEGVSWHSSMAIFKSHELPALCGMQLMILSIW
ncbi:unnamed protein product [Linum trigynum]|uniref:Uncharacterized protein n=1 Tax=Linum trigynum TaxID=586398 RepID=A0AAV2C6G8_9ROSI